jgi:hypothetical protein
MADAKAPATPAGFSISDLIMNQMANAGKPRTSVQTVDTTSTQSPQPLDWGQLGMMLALILGNQTKGSTTVIPGQLGPSRDLSNIPLPAVNESNPAYFSSVPATPMYSPSAVGPVGANALPLLNTTNPMDLLQALLKMYGQG